MIIGFLYKLLDKRSDKKLQDEIKSFNVKKVDSMYDENSKFLKMCPKCHYMLYEDYKNCPNCNYKFK